MNWTPEQGTLRIAALRALYQSGDVTPEQVIEAVYQRIEAAGDDHVWIHLVPRAAALERACRLAAENRNAPLYGIPFAVKDNMDVAGLPTTAGCPGFGYFAGRSAVVVEKLFAAGAILVGKTNMDQFATGLAGVRSPYGVPRNPFDARYIPGGSSAGSAVAVAAGLVSFSLGTDTAGSGRVPAAFNNIVGLKPSRDLLSTKGVVPACKTLDCVSILALTCDDAARVARELEEDSPTAGKRPAVSQPFQMREVGTFRFGVPAPEAREFFGNSETPRLFEQAIQGLEQLGGIPVTVDMEPLRETGRLLYDGPWIAERVAALQPFLEDHEAELLPVTRTIIEKGKNYSAVQAFEGFYRLADLRRRAESMWDHIDVLLLPTAGSAYSLDEVAARPIERNTELGYYTNFVNLLGYSAVAVPAGFEKAGLPFGVSLIGPAQHDSVLLGIADRFHRLGGLRLGATTEVVPAQRTGADHIVLAVVGAHLRGLPLNYQLTDLRAQFVRQCRTARIYRLYQLVDSKPPKPGLVRVTEGGVSIEVELWRMRPEDFGRFVKLVPSPLTIGSVSLESGEMVKGFLCESAEIPSARDISAHGGWRPFLASLVQG